MDKWKKVLIALNDQISSKELEAAVKADNFGSEFEPSEDGVAAIIAQTKGLFSVDSAVNNPEIIEKISKDLYPKHMKSALSKVETGLKPMLDKLGIDPSKYEYLSDSIGDLSEAIDKQVSEGGDVKLIESLKKDLAEKK